ncbi:MAG: transglutaminase/protease-like cytokinesis protein 3 [Cyclobacteriaceae bacterium]|jgi:transglutaminase/protease-like cytokinesis protein 3
MKYLTTIFLFLSIFHVNAQELLHYTEHNRLWDYVESTPSNIETNPEELVKYLSKVTKNQRELIEVIYYWISQNIEYDVEGYSTGVFDAYEAQDVLISKSSVCGGYSNLFQLLCESAGIECVVISGFAKGFGYSKEEDMRNDSIPNHAWNAVKLNGDWKLVDSTWGSGYCTIEDGNPLYKKSLNLGYIFTKPDGFAIEHFPEEPKWQLLDKPISREEFYADSTDAKIQYRYRYLR